MVWLGEVLSDQAGATHAPRRVKDLIEERLFARRRTLFSDLSVVLFDTTSLYFYGAGGSFGRRGKTKDHRPDLRQVVVGVVLDNEGRPICSETWSGNTADVTALMQLRFAASESAFDYFRSTRAYLADTASRWRSTATNTASFG